jgi:hypothetical protein
MYEDNVNGKIVTRQQVYGGVCSIQNYNWEGSRPSRMYCKMVYCGHRRVGVKITVDGGLAAVGENPALAERGNQAIIMHVL